MAKPITREEQFLAAMAGEGTAPKPLTRKEQFMAKSAGQAETAPTPLTRKEGFMDDISVGGSTPTGTISITENGTFDVTDYASAEVSVGIPFFIINFTFDDEELHPTKFLYESGMTWAEFIGSEYNPPSTGAQRLFGIDEDPMGERDPALCCYQDYGSGFFVYDGMDGEIISPDAVIKNPAISNYICRFTNV